MKISNNWLQDYLKTDLSIDETSDLLTDIGLEVEGVENHESIKGGLIGIVIGKILTVEKHPDADRLNLTTVDIGEGDPLHIVCGAPNVAVNLKVPVATVGTWIHIGDDSFKIKRSKIRGQVSDGMICGPDEIGLGAKTDGIMELPDDAPIGQAGSKYFDIKTDTIFEIGLTPNRTDAMSHIGVARDLKAALNSKDHNLKMCLPSVKDFSIDSNSLEIKVDVQTPELCPRYSGLTISNITVKDSPEWLKNRLLSIGINPINNIVDITNYVLHETGQPLHAFDANKIDGNTIIVKTAKSKSKFITLDEIERELSVEDLMICNENEPMCIAGVFGGLKSGVNENTTTIFLESAYFNPISIRKTAKRHILSTDASFRYERGCDPNITVYALKRAAILIKEICNGEITSDIIDFYQKPIENVNVNFSFDSLNKIAGEKINQDLVKKILKNLEINIVEDSGDSLILSIPTYRVDVTREIDVIEEVLRIYGFNTIALPDKLSTSITISNSIDSYKLKKVLSNLLASNGFHEIMNNSLTKSSYNKFIEELKDENNVNILNPLSSDLNIMRRTLLFSALESVEYNNNRKNSNLKFFEFGKSYQIFDKYEENQHLYLTITGNKYEENWNVKNEKVDFFFIKEIVHTIISRLGLTKYKVKEVNTNGLSSGLMYSVKKKPLVYFGNVDSNILKSYKIRNSVFIADFNWDLILDLVGNNKIVYKAVNKFPIIRRDLSLLINQDVSFSQLEKIARSVNNSLLQEVNLFDVYIGDKLPDNKKSYAISFVFEDNSKTLTDYQIDEVMKKLIAEFESSVGAEIR
ncbi:MAG: phenylalanine--tRNA ligase subunit beta [Flavobacteriales bacterium]